MKKVIGMILPVVFLLSMSVTAFAAEPTIEDQINALSDEYGFETFDMDTQKVQTVLEFDSIEAEEMLNFEANPPSVLTGESVAALIFAAIIFIVVPIFLAIAEYRITKKEKKNGLYLMLGAFASVLLLGVYSLFVGLLLLVVFWVASSLPKRKSQINENGL